MRQKSATPPDRPTTFWLVRRMLRPHRRRMAVIGGLVTVGAGVQIWLPILLQEAVDGARDGFLTQAYWRALLLIIAGVGAQGITLIETYLTADLGQRATNRLRAELTTHLVGLESEFFATHPPGALIERVDGDTTLLTGLFSSVMVELAQGVLTLVGVITVTWLISPMIAWAILGILVVTVAFLWVANRYGHPRRIARSVAASTAFGIIEERLAGLDDTRTSGAVAYAQWQVESHLRRWVRASFGAHLWNGVASGTITIGMGAILAATIFGGTRTYLAGETTLGALIAMIAYVEILRRPVEQLGRQAQEVGQALAGAARIAELFSIQTDQRIPPMPRHSAQEVPTGALSVMCTGVRFAYPGATRDALVGVTLTIPAGAVVGIVGHTGSGKSTFGRLVARAIVADEGSVVIGGIDVREIPETHLRSRVAVVTQETSLFHASVRDNVALFDDDISDVAIRAALRAVGMESWLARLPDGLATRLAPGGGRPPADPNGDVIETRGLSAGEAQLLNLARVFLRDPGLVILDEPTARIDPELEAGLVVATKALADAGRTVLIIAHRPSTIVHATHIATFENGRLIAFHAQARSTSTPNPAPVVRDDGARLGPPAQVRTEPDGVFGLNASTSEGFGVLRGLIGAYRGWWLASVTLAGVVGYVIGLIPGLLQRSFLDEIAGPTASRSTGWDYGIAMALFALGRGVHMATTITIESTTQSTGAAILGANAFRGVLASRRYPALPASPGEAVSRFRDDTTRVGAFVTWLGDPIGQLGLGLGVFTILAQRDLWLAVACFGPIMVGAIIAQSASGAVQRARARAAMGVADVTDLLGDIFTSVAALQFAGAGSRAVARLVRRSEYRRRATLREVVLTRLMESLWRNIATLTSGIVLVVSIPALSRGDLTAGDVSLTVSYVAWLTVLGGFYGQFVVQLRQTSVSLGRLHALMPDAPIVMLATPHWRGLWGAEAPVPDAFPAPVGRIGSARPANGEIQTDEAFRTLTVADLTFQFRDSEVPDASRLATATATGIVGASITLHAGMFVAITGPAGAGKTTLVRALLGLLPRKRGTINWNEVVVRDPGSFLVPPRVGYTAQVPRLFSDTIRANIMPGATSGPEATHRLETALHLAGLDRDLADGLLDLDGAIGPRGMRISGGQQQRVATARMFATGATVVVVDDLSSALDEATEAIVWDRVRAAQTHTVIAVTNRPLVIAMAHLVISVDHGTCRVVRNTGNAPSNDRCPAE